MKKMMNVRRKADVARMAGRSSDSRRAEAWEIITTKETHFLFPRKTHLIINIHFHRVLFNSLLLPCPK